MPNVSRGVAPAFQDHAVARRVAADDLRLGAHRAALGIAALALGVVFVGWLFSSIADPTLLTIWLALQGGLIASFYIAYAIFVNLKLDDDAMLAGPWLRIGKLVMDASNVLTAASIWMLLPKAPTELVHLMILLYCWYIFVQFAADTSASVRSTAPVVILLASIAAFVVWRGLPYAPAIALFFAAFGATVIGMRGIVRRAVSEAFEARTAAQHSAAALEVALAQVAAERDAKSRFLAAASHDLQQPIQAAHLYFGQLARVDHPQLRGEIEAAGKMAFGAAQSLLAAMLDHLRLGAQAVTPQTERVALAGLFAQVAAEARLAADAGPDIRWVTTVTTVRADRALLVRALTNLVQNAVRHSGGTRILIAARTQRGAVRIHVIDDGCGIPAHCAESVFEEFGRGNSSSAVGFGIGLASARAAMRVQGGDVLLDPRWRRGAAFNVVLAPSAVVANDEALCAAA